MERIGVIICHCEYHTGGAEGNLTELVEKVKHLPGVTYAASYKGICSDTALKELSKAIREKALEGVVVTSCLPAVHEKTIKDTVVSAGLLPQQLEIARLTLNDQERSDEWLAHIQQMIRRLSRKNAFPPSLTPVTKKALVIGGGVSGIHAALDIANGGYEVYLVERTPSIGGHMVQLSEVFPTLDCPQCILTPKMVQCAQHSNIRILAYSEVEAVKGQVGNFEVLIKRKSTFIDWNRCTGCGECSKVCPVEMYSDFQRGTAPRKAIYKPFAQAVPNKFVIDKQGISPCRSACPLHLNCQGYVQLIKAGKFQEAISLIREKLPFPKIVGRVCDHPCERACTRAQVDSAISICALKRFLAERKEAASVPFIITEEKEQHVAIVGAGPAGLMAAYDLRRLGYQVTIIEARGKPGGLLIYGFPGYRLPHNIVEEEVGILGEMGVTYRLNTRVGREVTLRELQREYDALFLAVGAVGCSTLGTRKDDLTLPLTRRGTIWVDPLTLATGEAGIFAGGDAVTGPNTVIDAMAMGRRAALSIDRYLKGEDLCSGRLDEGSFTTDRKFDIDKQLRDYRYLNVLKGDIPPLQSTDIFKKVPTREEIRKNQRSPEMNQPTPPVLTPEEAVAEAARCLNCAGCCECMSCVSACEAQAVNHSLADHYETIHVGAIVVATGYELLPKEVIAEYESDPDVLDPLQFERLLCPSGPTEGCVVRPSDGKVPKEVVYIECVGSRDPEHHLPYCSRVCCMYSCKMGMLYKHAVPDGTMYIFYMDVRTDGKMYEEFYQRGAEEDGLIYLRGRVSKLFRDGDKIRVWGSDTLTGASVEIAADLVVLAMAMVPHPDAKRLAHILGLETDEFGFMKVAHPRWKPYESTVPGIFLAGCCQSPKDIPECVAHACGCAGKVLSLFSQDEVEVIPRVKEVVQG